jgi:hypothetical protein
MAGLFVNQFEEKSVGGQKKSGAAVLAGWQEAVS